VKALFNKIEMDPRHTSVTLLSSEEVSEKLFADGQ
jgi:hypothetical protein